MCLHVLCLGVTARSACTIQRSIEATESEARRVLPVPQGDVCGVVVIKLSAMYFITELLLSISRGCPSREHCRQVRLIALLRRRSWTSITKLLRESSPVLSIPWLAKQRWVAKQSRALRFQEYKQNDDATSLTSDVRPGYRCHEAKYEVIANNELRQAKQALWLQRFWL